MFSSISKITIKTARDNIICLKIYTFKGTWANTTKMDLVKNQVMSIWVIQSMHIIFCAMLCMDGNIYLITYQQWLIETYPHLNWVCLLGENREVYTINLYDRYSTNHMLFVLFLEGLRKRNTNVDTDDVKGAAAGIVRLFSEYRYAT